MESKVCVLFNSEKKVIIFTTNSENVGKVILKQTQYVTMKIKIKYLIIKTYFLEKKMDYCKNEIIDL